MLNRSFADIENSNIDYSNSAILGVIYVFFVTIFRFLRNFSVCLLLPSNWNTVLSNFHAFITRAIRVSRTA